MFPDFLGRVPTARHVSHGKSAERNCRVLPQEKSCQAAQTAENRRCQLRLPFVEFLDMLEKLHIALHYLGPGYISPPPETWGCRARHTRDRGLPTLVVDGDVAPL